MNKRTKQEAPKAKGDQTKQKPQKAPLEGYPKFTITVRELAKDHFGKAVLTWNTWGIHPFAFFPRIGDKLQVEHDGQPHTLRVVNFLHARTPCQGGVVGNIFAVSDNTESGGRLGCYYSVALKRRGGEYQEFGKIVFDHPLHIDDCFVLRTEDGKIDRYEVKQVAQFAHPVQTEAGETMQGYVYSDTDSGYVYADFVETLKPGSPSANYTGPRYR